MPSQSSGASNQKVFCFGVFDGIHDGHREMLKEARSLGNYLIISVTQDHIVEMLKKHKTRQNLQERIDALKAAELADEVVAGDPDISTWKVLQSYQPDVIALGYDQRHLLEAVTHAISHFTFPTTIHVLSPHRPDQLHSSLLFQST
ncbi:adenylyltransferase/cytidyltransferase family protein [Candidatus Gracilibacteria bacterium]|nr:adenylyltransferase/cytidyltransferase family protein [Candidatus Gracilibacteria bacterium]